jgi:hypothetical protein
MRTQRFMFGATLVLAASAGCSLVLGIEDVTQRPGTGGSGASTSSSATGGLSSSSASAGSTGGGTVVTSSGSAGGASSSSSGGAPQCLSCIGSMCGPALAACEGDAACPAWYDCFKTCSDSACATSCDQMQGGSKGLYAALYTCACSKCSTDCAPIDPCTHPCPAGEIYPPPMGNDTIFCPYAVADGGSAVYCAHSTQHCCEPSKQGVATCSPTGTTCTAGDVDWHCADGPTDCVGAAGVCCTNAGATVTFAATAQCETEPTTVTGTYCQTACDATQQQLLVCTSNSECTSPQKCWPIAMNGQKLGVCH